MVKLTVEKMSQNPPILYTQLKNGRKIKNIQVRKRTALNTREDSSLSLEYAMNIV